MKGLRPSLRGAALTVLGLLLADIAAASIFEQSYIFPERAGQNKVRWRNFDWQYVDFLKEEDGQGGVRLYYYDREREAAELAAAAIAEEYQHLKNTFNIVPDIRMPYILYASHLEFEEQNLFSISESILGVTSTEDLTLSLPYWGEHQRFVEVSRHEMAHQFTIQKAYQVQRLHQTRQNPLERIPLWFIEGLAEYSAHRGLHEEVPMYVADLLLNPDEDKYHKLYPYWHDEIRNFVQTYRMGQVRVAYLAERYGKDVVQNVLAKSYMMLQRPEMQPTDQIFGFQSFLEDLTAVKPKALDQDFKAWLREKFDIERLEKTEEVPKLEEQKAVSDTMDSYTLLPDGNLVMYRDIEITTGTTRLQLVDLRDEGSRATVAAEGKPGIESLHFFQRRVFDLADGQIAYTALDKGKDVLYLQKFTRREQAQGPSGVSVKLELGEREKIDLEAHDLLEAGDLAFSPDGQRLAFVGLTSDGRADVYVMDLGMADRMKAIQRLTTDFYAERGLIWGERGLLLSSDRTASGHFNLFFIDPQSGKLERVTYAEANHDTPSFAADGTLLFTSFESGKSNVWRLRGTTLERVTDTHTGLFEPREVPQGLLVRKFFRGRFRLYRANRDDLKPLQTSALTAAALAAPAAPAERTVDPATITDPSLEHGLFARRELDDAKDYNATDLSNWRVDLAGAALSSQQTGGLYLAFSDRMRDQSVVFDVSILGDFEYTDANIFYINRKRQLAWGVGVLHNLRIRRDTTFSTDPGQQELYLERDFGAYGILNYPFDRFTHVQLGLGVLGVHRFNYAGSFRAPEEEQWKQTTGGVHPEIDLSLSGGYDTVGYHYLTGPLSGTSLYGKVDLSFIPDESETLFSARTDLQRYTRIWKGVNVLTRVAGGVSFGDRRFREQYFVSSYDNLRGFDFSDDELLGYHFAVANAELQVPLGSLFEKPAIGSIIEGVVGFDVGSVFDELDWDELERRRSAAFILGSNFLLGPFMLRLHFAKPLDIGGLLPNNGDWQTNFSIRYAFM